MCELLGISVRPAATVGLYFREFRPRSVEHPSGWGIAWWEDGQPRVIKEPVPAHRSDRAAALADDPPTSETFIVHVRKATVGRICDENTHPFVAEAIGRRWVFAHNGTIERLARLDPGRFAQAGDTDSERAFHHLLTRLERLGPDADEARVVDELAEGSGELSEEGKVNLLLYDGRTLYAYHDGHRALWVLRRRAADGGTVAVADDHDYRIDLEVGDAPEERAVVVATDRLTDEPWERAEPGSFLVIRSGEVVDRRLVDVAAPRGAAR